MDKYLLTASIRADGSSRFGENNKYGYFPSFAAAWRLSEESFMPNVFSDFKLRAGWGQTGNQEIPNKISAQVLGIDATTGGFTYLRTSNPDIRWETSNQWNIGLDIGVLTGRVNVTLDYFNRTTTDILVENTAPAPSPTDRVWQNLEAELINSGIEFTVDASIIDGGNDGFNWSTAINVTSIQNTVENLPVDRITTGAVNGQGLSGVFAQVITNGESFPSFWGREFTGFDENGESIFANDGEEKILGNPLPTLTLGFNNTLSYKGFDLNFFFNGAFGHMIYNNTANALFSRSALVNGRNVPTEVANSDESTTAALQSSNRYLEDGSFIRLTNATLGYNFNLSNVDWISNLRLYVTGQNLLLFTGYSGFDPEVNTDKNINGVSSLGVDYTTYPRPRTVLVGLNVSF